MDKKKLTIEVPNSWEGISLREYLKLQEDIKAYGDTEEGLTAVLFFNLCDIGPLTMKKLDVEVYSNIKKDLMELMNQKKFNLKRIIDIDGTTYGFEPDLSKMSYGMYLDIQEYKDLAINEKWAEVMSMLYRPVTKSKGVLYEIEPYDGKKDSEKFMDLDMTIHFGALFFFLNILTQLSRSTLNSLIQMKEMPKEIPSILEKSGVLIQESTG